MKQRPFQPFAHIIFGLPFLMAAPLALSQSASAVKEQAKPRPSSSSTISLTSEDTRVLQFALTQQFTPKSAGYIINRSTVPLPEMTLFQKEQPTFPFLVDPTNPTHLVDQSQPAYKKRHEAFDAFLQRNASPRRLASLKLSKPLVFLEENESRGETPSPKLDAFQKKYPETFGLWEVSLPGYSADHTTAVVFVAFHGGSRDGSGEWYLLEKKKEQWILKNAWTAWCA